MMPHQKEKPNSIKNKKRVKMEIVIIAIPFLTVALMGLFSLMGEIRAALIVLSEMTQKLIKAGVMVMSIILAVMVAHLQLLQQEMKKLLKRVMK